MKKSEVKRRGCLLSSGFLLLLMLSCSRNDNFVSNNRLILTPLDVVGKWNIESFIDSSIDKTDQLAMITLQFNSDGNLFILSADSSYAGSWDIISQVALDELSIAVSNSSTYYTIFNRNWYVSEKTNSTLLLDDASISGSASLYLRRM